MSRGLVVVVNCASGKGHDERELERVRAAFRAAGTEARVVASRSGGELRSIVKSAMRERPATIVAGGGDGTLSTVAGVLRGSGIALGILPLGTLNHFAKDLGIPLELDAAVRIVLAGHRTEVDVGDVNGRVFINNSSLGIYPSMVRHRERLRHELRLGRGKTWALAWATLTALRRAPFLRVELRVESVARNYRAPFVFIGNNDYVMEGFDIGRRTHLADGKLSVYVTTRTSRLGLLALGVRALFGRLRQARDFEALSAQTIEVATRHKRLLVATDGEVGLMETPLHYRVHRLALVVLAPAPGAVAA